MPKLSPNPKPQDLKSTASALRAALKIASEVVSLQDLNAINSLSPHNLELTLRNIAQNATIIKAWVEDVGKANGFGW
jgi:hypothetical protein